MASTKSSAVNAPKHPFHLVDLSPWPLLASAASVLLVVGIVMAAHDAGTWLAYVGFLSLLLVSTLWFRDVIKESIVPGVHTKAVRDGFRWGMGLFIFSELMLFFAIFWGYFYIAFFPSEVLGNMWPPKGMETFDPFSLPYLNTIILLLSGTTVTWAHHDIVNGNTKGMEQKILYTVILGAIFTGIQAIEWSHAPFALEDNVYSSAFFVATGFHGAHVIIGTLFLAVCYYRAKAGHYTSDDHFSFEAAAWYWHFVDVVWIFLFFSIYMWR